jgi:hypothetical protein
MCGATIADLFDDLSRRHARKSTHYAFHAERGMQGLKSQV